MKKYYLGIDGGGTKTAYTVIDNENNIVFHNISGPSSIDTVKKEGFIESITKGLENCPYIIEKVFGGFGGICSEETKEYTVNLLKEVDKLKNATIEVENDIVNAILSGHGKREGMALIIGTGSVAYGEHDGKIHRCGGYCHQEGDAGSSYDLGHKALQHVARVIDKRANASILSNLIQEEKNINTFSDLVAYFQLGRTSTADVAKLVTKAASRSCPTAIKIIDNAVEEMMLMISTVYKELCFDKVNLSITGSLGNIDTYYKEKLYSELETKLPNIKIVNNLYSADHACALYAKNI